MSDTLPSQLLGTPLRRNLATAVATVVYVKVVVGLCDLLVSGGIVAPKVSRKIIHVAAGSWIIFWPLFDVDHWTWRLNVLVPAVYTVQLFVKGAILRDPNDQDVLTMTRTGSPSELLNGPIMFTIIMTVVGLKLFRTDLGVVIMACLGYGDGIAPLVGTYFPCGTHYPTFPFGPDDKKTLTGSIGFVVAAVAGYRLLTSLDLLAEDETPTDPAGFAVIATIAAVMEGLCGAYDNPTVAVAAAVAHRYHHHGF